MRIFTILICLSLTFTACKNGTETEKNQKTEQSDSTSATAEKLLHEIAEANGIKHWENISSVQYTFNVDRNGKHFQRSWHWIPKKNRVKMLSPQDTLTYERDGSLTEAETKADKAFINDKYWLLFPFQLVWDQGFSQEMKKQVAAPISGEIMTEISIAYDKNSGYTPGDTYKIYVSDDKLIREWSYIPAGKEKPQMTTTWEGYEKQNGILFAKNHQDRNKTMKLYFTEVSFQ